MPYRKDTTLWCSDSLHLNLKTCTCTGPHLVKLGGDYGGRAGCKRFSKKHIKGQVPKLLVMSIAKQLKEQLNIGGQTLKGKSCANQPCTTLTKYSPKLKSAKGGLIGSVFIQVTPDSGSSRATLTSETLKFLVKLCKQQGTSDRLTVNKVPQYRVQLANSAISTSTTTAVADLTLISSVGAAKLPRVHFNVIPGKISPLLLGRQELLRLGIPSLWDLINNRIKEERANKQKLESSKPVNELDD